MDKQLARELTSVPGAKAPEGSLAVARLVLAMGATSTAGALLMGASNALFRCEGFGCAGAAIAWALWALAWLLALGIAAWGSRAARRARWAWGGRAARALQGSLGVGMGAVLLLWAIRSLGVAG